MDPKAPAAMNMNKSDKYAGINDLPLLPGRAAKGALPVSIISYTLWTKNDVMSDIIGHF